MDNEQKRQLLTLARQTLEAHLRRRPLPPLPEMVTDQAGFGGAFVTLRNAGRLRGCIGQFMPRTGLAETVQQMAVSALRDPRFRDRPVTADELPKITVEISILSPMQKTADPQSLELGVHGIYVRKGPYAGCFLPQVATEQGWDKEQFLSHCCAGKAGLPPDAWRDGDAEVYLFTADILEEQHAGDTLE